MAGSASPEDVAARDDAQLRSLGIKPELKRSLGFLSNFAIAFAFISVSTGSFGNYGIGIGLSGPVFFWTWPIVIAGQLLVALVFAELASHFPVAGSVYQWSKRLSNRTLGWFTGWFYFWAQVVTVSAVAVIVAFVVDGLHGSLVGTTGDVAFLDTPSPGGFTSMFTFIAIGTLIITTLINAYGVRLLSILNNIGVATEILGMFVFAILLLIFANVQPASVLTSFEGSEAAQNGNLPATFALGFFMAAFIVFGFDTAGTFGEETIDATRQAPRGVLSSILISGLVGAIFIPAVILATPNIPASMEEGLAGGFPIATTISDAFSQDLIGNLSGGDIYLIVILASVLVCTLAIQGAATRLMFSMGRDRHLPFGGLWGKVNTRFQTPANAAIAVGVIAALPILVVGPIPAISISIAATGLIYVAYFMCNAGVLKARMSGWPHKPAWFNLGRWGKLVNILALIYGGLMIINIALWADTGLFGDWGTDGRLFWNPMINTFIKPFGNEIAGLPAWPIFETIVGAILISGALYYVVAVRGKAHDVESADAVTGEDLIGSFWHGAASDRRAAACLERDPMSDEILRGPLRDDLVAALQRVPEIAGHALTLTALTGGITNRNFLVVAEGTSDRWVIRLAGNDTYLLGISREVEHAATVAAAGVGVGPEVTAFIRPEGYLVTRFIEGTRVSDEQAHQPATLRRVADSLRRIHDGPAIPGLFIPLRIVEAYRGLAEARGVPIPPEYDLAVAVGRRIELACLTAPLPMRPCHNDLLNANFIDDGVRIRIVDWEYAGMGDPFFDLGNVSINHELTAEEDAILLAAYDGEVRPDRLARLTLMRVVSDFREAMWGVLQQGVSTLDVDFAAYAAEHFDRLLANAATPAFERALREAAGD